MALFTIKEVAEQLQCTPQNIYKQQSKLKEKGFVEKDSTTGAIKINESGLNYLKQQRINSIQQQQVNSYKPFIQQNNESPVTASNSTVENLLKEQIEKLEAEKRTLKEEVVMWQERYIESQNKIVPFLIEQKKKEEQEEEKVEETKKGFWHRFKK